MNLPIIKTEVRSTYEGYSPGILDLSEFSITTQEQGAITKVLRTGLNTDKLSGELELPEDRRKIVEMINVMESISLT